MVCLLENNLITTYMKTTVIGSFPKPIYLIIPDWFKNYGKETQKYNDYLNNLPLDHYQNIDKAIKEVINIQDTIGIDIITSGEVNRENYIYGFKKNIIYWPY